MTARDRGRLACYRVDMHADALPIASPLTGPSYAPRDRAPEAAVLLLHGVGADGNDLIDLARVLGPALPPALFVAPDAPFPYDMAPFGRQWFSLQDRRPAAMLAGLDRVAPLVDGLIDDMLARTGLPASRLAILGFSQGTMTALHVAPRRPEALAAVVGFSGRLVGGERLPTETRSRLPVLLVHGDSDDVVPPQALPEAVMALGAAGFAPEALMRPGLGHGIDADGLEAAAAFLARAFGTGE